MRSQRPARTRSTVAVTAFSSAAVIVAVLTPAASAAASPLPLPLPAAGSGGEPLVNIDGHLLAQPLVNNLTLPTLK